jgi:hypothetical protein
MTRICWWLVNILSQALERNEQDAAYGDLAESGESGGQALREVLGLVVRRQAAFWKDGRPWLALVGLVVPFGMMLSVVSGRTADGSAIYLWLYANNWDWGIVGGTGFQHDIVRFGAGVLLSYLTLVCYSWAVGFIVGSLSRRAIPVNGAVFCLMLLLNGLFGDSLLFRRARDFNPNGAVFDRAFYRVIFPWIVQTVLVLLPSLWGMREGFRVAALRPLFRAILWTSVIASLAAIDPNGVVVEASRRTLQPADLGHLAIAVPTPSCILAARVFSRRRDWAALAPQGSLLEKEATHEPHVNSDDASTRAFRNRGRCRSIHGPRRIATGKHAQGRAGVRVEGQLW